MSSVTYVDHMGSDLTVVNSARVSFDKKVSVLSSKDAKLINYLAKHQHWTPFAHVQVTLLVEAPVFVARQLVKHQVGLVWNEVSRRYVSDAPTFHVPDLWRQAADNVKQGSSAKPIQHNGVAGAIYHRAMLRLQAVYKELLDMGVCPEQARMVLPQSMMTSWYWTGSLVAFARVVNQRTHSTAQVETKAVAIDIDNVIKSLEDLKVSWNALLGEQHDY
jgi:thymidylate synthase (FAD)